MTPYGYKIVDGRAVVDAEAAWRLLRFFELFLSGSSMSTAAREADLTVCASSYPRLFYRTIYTGDDFYPAIIAQYYQDQLIAEYERRRASSNQGVHKKLRKAVPIHTCFRLRYPASVDTEDPVTALYDRIKPTVPRPSHTERTNT